MARNNGGDRRESDLEERVSELEQTVADMLPGRRAVLQGAGAMGLLGLGASSAAAETSSTNDGSEIGSPDDRVDVFASKIDAGSIRTNSANNVKWAESPNEINELLDELPPHGGTIKLVPGEYGDDDWSRTIEIPAGGDPIAAYGIDMSGSRINLTEQIDGPYIYKPPASEADHPSAGNAAVHIHGPNRMFVDKVTDPGPVMKLWDTGANQIYWPHVYGPVEWVYEDRSGNGSGHWSQVYVKGVNPRGGIKVGEEGDDQTTDRCIYYGQFNNIIDVGVEVNWGQSNHFFVQPENGDPDEPKPAVGYRIRFSGNTIWNWHSGDNIHSLDIAAPYTIIRPYGSTTPTVSGLRKLTMSVPPRNIIGGRAVKHVDTFNSFDFDHYELIEEGNARVVRRDSFSRITLNAGQTDGDVAGFQDRCGVGSTQDGAVASWTFNPYNSGDRIDRFGLVDKSPPEDGESIGFGTRASIYVECDGTQTDPTWEFVVCDTDGTEQFRHDTEVEYIDEDGDGQEIITNWTTKHQSCFVNYNNDDVNLPVADVSFSNYDTWTFAPRCEVEVRGSPTEDKKFDLWAREIATFPKLYFYRDGSHRRDDKAMSE